mgnify:CR=1 FL=1
METPEERAAADAMAQQRKAGGVSQSTPHTPQLAAKKDEKMKKKRKKKKDGKKNGRKEMEGRREGGSPEGSG